MDCSKAQTMLNPYLDGELDLVTGLAIEEHFRLCTACAVSQANFRTLQAGMRDESLYFTGSAAFQKRMEASIRRSAASGTRTFALRSQRFWGLAAALVLLGFFGWDLARVRTVPSGDSLVASEIVASHVRSLMGSHLADVASSSQHTVKPWFAGRLDYSPPVTDLAAQGFPLIGGRLDYLDARPVAALVYRHQKHLINLFVWPIKTGEKDDGAGQPDTLTVQGYHVLHWNQAGMTYWTISDLNSAEMSQFERLIQEKDTLVPVSPTPPRRE